jgi:hypothetical protein
MGVVNFDMTFSYVLAGWEGCAHDSEVFRDALTKGLYTQLRRYYLGDAGYPLGQFCLTPYRGVRYHLKEFGIANQRPQNARELFNLRHSSLRNIVERAFGVLKKRFEILNSMTSYSMDTQIKLVKSCFMIHNFIKVYGECEDEFEPRAWREEFDAYILNNNDDPAFPANIEEDGDMDNYRDQIAADMWISYQAYLVAHPNA